MLLNFVPALLLTITTTANTTTATTGDQNGHDPELEKKIKEMESNRLSAWEEKERLSQALEAERQVGTHMHTDDVYMCIVYQYIYICIWIAVVVWMRSLSTGLQSLLLLSILLLPYYANTTVLPYCTTLY